MASRRLAHISLRASFLIFFGALALAWLYRFAAFASHASRAQLLDEAYWKALYVFWVPIRDVMTDPRFLLPLAGSLVVTLALERWIPADRKQEAFGLALAQDFVWVFYEIALFALVVVAYGDVLARYYAAHLSGLTVTGLGAAPGWARFLVAFLLTDFLYWAHHVVNHKVPLFWRFHQVHHAQRELNFFTDFRYHVVEYVIRQTFLIVPFLLLKVDAPAVAAFAVASTWYTRIYHGNVRTNLGPLRWVLVTPQSHRVHHAVDERHHDMNFGALLSVWDRLFGTQCRDSDVYPETGVRDETFPDERRLGARWVLVTPLLQMAHPFATVWRSSGERGGEARPEAACEEGTRAQA